MCCYPSFQGFLLFILRPFALVFQIIMDRIHVEYADFGVFFTKIVVWPNCDIFVDWIISSIVVLSVRELISSICCAQFVFQEHVVLLSLREVSGDSWTYFPGVPIVAEVCMVGVHEDGDFSTLQ